MNDFEKLLNERIPLREHTARKADPHANDTETDTEAEADENSGTDENEKHIDYPLGMMEASFPKVGIGVSWLRKITQPQKQGAQSIMSEEGRHLLRGLMEEHNLISPSTEGGAGDNFDSGDFLQKDASWDFLEQLQGKQTTLFSTIVSTIQHELEMRKLSNSGTSTDVGGETKPFKEQKLSKGDNSCKSLSNFCTTNQIIKACSEKINEQNLSHFESNILCSKDLPANLDSANTIYAALIFLSAEIPTLSTEAQNEIKREEETEEDSYFHELFPTLPILQKNEVGASLENIYPSAFALAYSIDLKDDEFTEKLNRLETFFFKSFASGNGNTNLDYEYISRLRVIPRFFSNEKNSDAAIVKEELFLKMGEVKRITRKRRKVDKGATTKDPSPTQREKE